mmetsp:Transcript_43335/g.125275  ORF Transcript_43335/g.125275 Transcript_43335/m.125275 type:complete len:151 (+) Transcript_43335:47-499(+)
MRFAMRMLTCIVVCLAIASLDAGLRASVDSTAEQPVLIPRWFSRRSTVQGTREYAREAKVDAPAKLASDGEVVIETHEKFPEFDAETKEALRQIIMTEYERLARSERAACGRDRAKACGTESTPECEEFDARCRRWDAISSMISDDMSYW